MALKLTLLFSVHSFVLLHFLRAFRHTSMLQSAWGGGKRAGGEKCWGRGKMDGAQDVLSCPESSCDVLRLLRVVVSMYKAEGKHIQDLIL